jgi:hypothetical protein
MSVCWPKRDHVHFFPCSSLLFASTPFLAAKSPSSAQCTSHHPTHKFGLAGDRLGKRERLSTCRAENWASRSQRQQASHWANLSKARMQAWSGVYKAARHTNADKKLKERNKVALVIFRARVPLRRNNKIDACFLLPRRWWEKNFHCEINLIVFARSSGSNVHEQVRVRRAEKNKRSSFGRESPRESSAGRPTNAPRVECAINKRVFANWASKCGKRGGSSAATNGRAAPQQSSKWE